MRKSIPLHGRDHRPGGSDPIPGLGGGGILFDTDNVGGYLKIATTDGVIEGDPEAFVGISMLSTGGDINVTADSGYAVNISGYDNLALISDTGAVDIKSGHVTGSIYNSRILLGSDLLIKSGDAQMTIDGFGVVSLFAPGGATIQADSGTDLNLTAGDNAYLTAETGQAGISGSVVTVDATSTLDMTATQLSVSAPAGGDVYFSVADDGDAYFNVGTSGYLFQVRSGLDTIVYLDPAADRMEFTTGSYQIVAGNEFVVTDGASNPIFRVDEDGTIHGPTGGSITWDL